MEKLIEILKGKKQIVALFCMWILSTLTAESCHPAYISSVAIVAIIAQTYLDKGENHEKVNANNSAGNNSFGGVPTR